MNISIRMGRLTKDPLVTTSKDGKTKIARFSLAVDRRFKREGQPEADFFNYTAFGKSAEFVEKYLKKGTKVVVNGEDQNNNYEKDGQKVYGMQTLVNTIEFAESKKAAEANGSATSAGQSAQPAPAAEDFSSDVPDDLPFV